MKLGTHMPDGERRKPIDIEVCRIKVKVTTSKNRTKIIHFSFVSDNLARHLGNERKSVTHLALRKPSCEHMDGQCL
jgi:CRISPR/Cas system-associated endonuclease Cas3-HD